MASYRIIGVRKDVEVRGGNKLVPIREYHVIATSELEDGRTEETYFQFRRDATVLKANVQSSAQQFADRIEDVLNSPFVTDVVYSQDTSQGGRLQDRMTTYWRDPTADDLGDVEGDVESALANFGLGYTYKQVYEDWVATRAFLGS